MDKIKVMDKMRKKKSLSLVNIAGILLFLCSIFWFMFEAEEEAGLSLLEVSKDDEGSLSITERTGRPEAVLFLSFPNSGTEFTLNTLKLATRTKSATNYKSESKSGKQLYPTIPNGPFLKDDKGTEIPKKYILTKTHCSGYSRDGSISSYIVNSEQFEKSCFSVMLNETTEVEYDSSVMPTKAIRLVRDPFDNIVSNYHHWLHNSLQNNDTLLEDYPSDRERFHEFCRRYDARFNELMDEEHVALFNHTRTTAMIVDVPCHQFFFRYVQVRACNNNKPSPSCYLFYIINSYDYSNFYNCTCYDCILFFSGTTMQI